MRPEISMHVKPQCTVSQLDNCMSGHIAITLLAFTNITTLLLILETSKTTVTTW